MRKVFLEDLPRRGKRVDWRKSINHSINFVYDDISGIVYIKGYESDSQKLTIEYNNVYFDIKTGHFSKGKLGNLLGKSTRNFKIKLGEVFQDNKRDLTIIDREYRDIFQVKCKNPYIQKYKWYKYHCNKCKYEGWTVEGSLQRGYGCLCCANGVVVEGVNDIPTTSPWMVKYFQGGYNEAKLYAKSSNKKIYPICPDCGCIKSTLMIICNINRRKSINCDCQGGKSYPEKFMFSVLNQLNLDFRNEVKFDWCLFSNYNNKEKKSNGIYDFVIENLKIIIEVDGAFHITDNKMNGRKKEESKYIDIMKDELAIKNGYKIIRINCFTSEMNEIKENILNSELANLFDFSKIDWIKCESFALSNIVKSVCEYWNKNEKHITVGDMQSIFNIERKALTSYLKKGTKLGWCNYNKNNEYSKGRIKGAKTNSKEIKVFKDDKLLGKFPSSKWVSENSIELFSVKLEIVGIRRNATGESKTYKGFTFKYVD